MAHTPTQIEESPTAAETAAASDHPKFQVLKEMLKAGVHMGHRTSRWSPKMHTYIQGVKGTVHILDLEKTLQKLEAVEKFVEQLAKDGKVVLFVGTKPSARVIVEAEAKRCGMPYVTNRWLGGTLTNFTSLSGRLRHFLDLEAKKQKGELEKYTKKERVDFDKELGDLETKFGGIKYLNRIPDALFIIDITEEMTAVKEAQRVGIPSLALVDTNADPTLVTHPIPANDDAMSAVTFIVARIADAVIKGKTAAMQQGQGGSDKTA